MSSPASPRAALFDIDGTLIDSNELHVKAWNEAFREAGCEIALDSIRAQIGKGGDNLLPALLPDAGNDVHQRISKRNGEIFKSRYLALARPFAEATALLRKVHADRWQVVLASSAERAEIDHYIDLLGVADVVAASAGIDDVKQSKPAPDIFAASLHKVSVAPENAVVIGDTVWDIEAAAKIGVRSVAVRSGGVATRALKQAGASVVYENAEALLAQYHTSPFAGF